MLRVLPAQRADAFAPLIARWSADASIDGHKARHRGIQARLIASSASAISDQLKA
jgi:hypothetical protein